MNNTLPAKQQTKPLEPLAYVTGKPVEEIPAGLYIHPDALKVFLTEFSGPLDLLLYLIRRHNIDIVVINIAEIANQYLEYIKLMKEFKIQLAAEYLVMAAILTELKSRALIPSSKEEHEEGEEVTAALVAKLKEYEKIRDKADELESRPRLDRDFFVPFIRHQAPPPSRKLLPNKEELADYIKKMMLQKKLRRSYEIKLEELSTRERMSQILDKVSLAKQLGRDNAYVPFDQLFTAKEGREGVAVSLLALTQLLKERLAEATQSSPFSRIYVYSPDVSADEVSEGMNEDLGEVIGVIEEDTNTDE